MYADYEHPTVQALAQSLAQGAQSNAEIIERIFHYVRDDILFGFHPEIDQLNASEIIEHGKGQCNNKSIVFLALCRALNMPAQIHFSDIDRAIHRGFIPTWSYPLFPKRISHSWLEVELDGNWYKIDSYINDADLFNAGREKLLTLGWAVGYSVANPEIATLAFSLDNDSFVQMAAVTKSYGSYPDPADYFQSPHYHNRSQGLRRLVSGYVLREMERRVVALRNTYRSRMGISQGKEYNRSVIVTS